MVIIATVYLECPNVFPKQVFSVRSNLNNTDQTHIYTVAIHAHLQEEKLHNSTVCTIAHVHAGVMKVVV